MLTSIPQPDIPQLEQASAQAVSRQTISYHRQVHIIAASWSVDGGRLRGGKFVAVYVSKKMCRFALYYKGHLDIYRLCVIVVIVESALDKTHWALSMMDLKISARAVMVYATAALFFAQVRNLKNQVFSIISSAQSP